VVVLVVHLAGVGGGDGVPTLPGVVEEDDEGDEEADDWVGKLEPERLSAGR
jgi:hypothetical protein